MSNDIEYACAEDGTQIAYRTFGSDDGPDYVVVAGAFFSVDMLEQDRVASRFLEGLASMGRLTVFDKRGVGSSDPISDWSRSAQDQWADDLLVVVEAAGLTRPVVVSWETMGVARLAVSQRPDVFSKMVLINPMPAPGHLMKAFLASGSDSFEPRSVEELAFPSRINDPEFEAWLVRAGRVGASPSIAPRMWDLLLSYDAPLTPPGITIPTLVLHNAESIIRREWIDDVAGELENVEVVAVPGADAYPISGDVDPLLVEIGRFTDRDAAVSMQRSVQAVLFTDLVASTQTALTDGDRAWSARLEHHDAVVRRTVTRRAGTVVKFTGDGALCLLPSASAALDTATELHQALAPSGFTLRCGIHVGDVDHRNDDVSGICVNVAARVMSLAPDGGTLVTTSVAEAGLGSPHNLIPAGTHQLKGIDGTWTLHQLMPAP